ncbi:MAG TPA: hypothetical protein VKZ96_00485 [Thermomicrobiales bacterium]|nr:hypothetical protein [Thermomicrobiales bacterium]
MISPHPTTAQMVAEAARRERLARLTAAHRYPGRGDLIWARFKAGPVIRWLEFRQLRPMPHEAGREDSDRLSPPAPSLGDG